MIKWCNITQYFFVPALFRLEAHSRSYVTKARIKQARKRTSKILRFIVEETLTQLLRILHLMESFIHTMLLQELLMGSLLHQPSVLHNYDPVGIFYSR